MLGWSGTPMMHGSEFSIVISWISYLHVLLSLSQLGLHSFFFLYFSHLASFFTSFVRRLVCVSHNGGIVSMIPSSPPCVIVLTPSVPAAGSLPVGALLHTMFGSRSCKGFVPGVACVKMPAAHLCLGRDVVPTSLDWSSIL